MIPSKFSAVPAPTEPEASFSPALVLRAVRKHWPILAGIFICSVIGASLYTANQRKIFEALATVQLDPQPLTPMGHSVQESGSDSYWSNQEYFATQHQVITSRRVAELVVKKLGLNTDGAFLMNLPTSTPIAAKVSSEDAAETLRSRLKVEPIEDSRLARVKYADADPARAQRVLAALVDTYVDQNLDTSMDAVNKTVEWLDTQVTRLKSDLEAQEMDLHDFKIKNNLLSVSYNDQANMVRASIALLNTDLTELKGKREAIASRLTALKAIDGEDPEIPTTELLADTNLQEARKSFANAKREAAMMSAAGRGENHPLMRSANAQIASAREALAKQLATIKSGAQLDLVNIDRQLAGLTGLYDSARHEALELNLKELEYSRLQRAKENTEKLFSMVLERSTESGLVKMAPFNNVRVLDRPLIPKAPVFPKTSTNLAVGMALGLLFGLVGAVGRDLMDRTVRSSEDIERDLGLALLGSLPDVTREGSAMTLGYYGRRRSRKKQLTREAEGAETTNMSPELLVHTHPKSLVAEAARAIRTNLMFMSPDTPFQCLLVTSAGPADGKTTVAASIAVAIAQTGQRVCLVDCDLRKPRVHTLFKEPNESGLTTALLKPEQLPSLVTATEIPNLSILRSGPTPPNPADLMHSDAFGALLLQLRAQFDRIVIDSPPIGLVTDGVILATRVDATVLVVRMLSTRRDGIKRAMRSLRDVGATCAGFVMNAVPSPQAYYYSGYYAPYGASSQQQAPTS
jgi:polysaccharide biosynthesis transport protein